MGTPNVWVRVRARALELARVRVLTRAACPFPPVSGHSGIKHFRFLSIRHSGLGAFFRTVATPKVAAAKRRLLYECLRAVTVRPSAFLFHFFRIARRAIRGFVRR